MWMHCEICDIFLKSSELYIEILEDVRDTRFSPKYLIWYSRYLCLIRLRKNLREPISKYLTRVLTILELFPNHTILYLPTTILPLRYLELWVIIACLFCTYILDLDDKMMTVMCMLLVSCLGIWFMLVYRNSGSGRQSSWKSCVL